LTLPDPDPALDSDCKRIDDRRGAADQLCTRAPMRTAGTERDLSTWLFENCGP